MVVTIFGRFDGRIAVQFEKNQQIIDAVRGIPGRRWEYPEMLWSLPDTQSSVDLLLRALWETRTFATPYGTPVVVDPHATLKIQFREAMEVRHYDPY